MTLDDYEDDEFADNGPEEVPCQSCGELIYADADRCPVCGHWQTDEFAGPDAPPRSRYPRWVSVTSLTLLALIAWWWLSTLGS